MVHREYVKLVQYTVTSDSESVGFRLIGYQRFLSLLM